MKTDEIKRLAYESGFDLCGVCSPEVIPESRTRFESWLSQGYHGEMAYMARDSNRRTDPTQVMPEVRSIIMLGLNYYQKSEKQLPVDCGRVSRYARGRDYHKVTAGHIKKFLRAMGDQLELPDETLFRWYVDYGPISERAYAEQAGLGFIGKNGMLINRSFGSWIFLSAVLTSLELEPDNRQPITHGSCADCRLCLEACPTGAIVSPREIDARKCISYLTVERPSSIPPKLAGLMGELVFGCDICQEVCPHNRAAVTSAHAEFEAEHGVGEFLNLPQVLSLQSREDFLGLVAGTPLTRPRLEGLQRNAAIVSRNGRSSPEE